MANLILLNRQRDVMKSRVDKLSKFLDVYEVEEKKINHEVLIKTKLNSLLETKADVKQLIMDYTQLPEVIDLKDNLTLSMELEEEIEDLEIRFRIFVSKCEFIDEVENVSKTVSKSNYKLPDLLLPQFYGKYRGRSCPIYPIFKNKSLKTSYISYINMLCPTYFLKITIKNTF